MKVPGSLLSEDTLYSFVCEGRHANQSPWKLVLNAAEGNTFEGRFEGIGGAFTLKSLHEQASAMNGPLRGYVIAADDGQAVVAIRRVSAGAPGALYFDARAASDPNLLGVALALTLYKTDH